MPAEVQGSTLNQDDQQKRTSSYWGNRGDGTSKWYAWRRTADGGDITQGATTDVAVTAVDSTAGTVIGLLKGLISRSRLNGYPPAATPVIAGATGVAGAIAATLAAVSAKTNYLAGFEITGSGATAASVITVTVTGLLGGTRSYKITVPAGVTAAVAPLIVAFDPPLPGSAVNTAIAVNVPSFGAGNTDAAVVAHGFVV